MCNVFKPLHLTIIVIMHSKQLLWLKNTPLAKEWDVFVELQWPPWPSYFWNTLYSLTSMVQNDNMLWTWIKHKEIPNSRNCIVIHKHPYQIEEYLVNLNNIRIVCKLILICFSQNKIHLITSHCQTNQEKNFSNDFHMD